MNHFITIPQVRLHFLEWGNPVAPPLVLLHGGAAHAHWWDHIAPMLAEQYHVVDLDLRGHGDSNWVVPPAYEIEDYVSDLEETFAALHLDAPVVMGHSLGGFIALTYATRHAATLRGLIVVDIGFRLRSSRTMRFLRNMPAPHYQNEEEVVRRFQLLPTETFAALPLLHHIARTSVRSQETGGLTLKFDRATMGRAPRDVSSILETITCPTLLLRGSHSQHFAATTMTEMLERCLRARGVEIPGAGHHVFLDNPTAFLSAVRDFLREEFGGAFMTDLIHRAAQALRTARKTIALTGAGISAESGIPTFRDPGGLWERYDPEEYATIEAFRRTPGKVWQMMKDFTELKTARPNPGHYGLAQLEQMGFLRCIITQNVDNLHQDAGSRDVIEFHGNMRQVICQHCEKTLPLGNISLETLPPYCSCGGVFKPAGVFFGEPIPLHAMLRSQEEAQSCDVILVIGTSAVVYPAADIPRVAKQSGAHVIEINPERTDLTGGVSHFLIQEKAGVAIPQIVAAIKAMAS